MANEKLILIDGHALAYRAYHALRPDSFSTRQGELTNAVYGFTSMLLAVLRDEQPDYIAVTFDVGRTFRHEEYPPYKAHREAMPEELATQLQRINEMVKAFNIPIFTAEGYEADDVLGTLARQASQQGVGTLIVTGDTDTFQLIDENTQVLTSRRRYSDTVIYDETGIQERYGLKPRQIIDYKGLVGDSSDNIPGVRGVGKKTATQLLQKYGSIEAIYEHLDEVESPRFRKALEEGQDDAFLSKHLATIVTDVPLELDLEACRVAEYDHDRVTNLFRELEFRSLLKRLPQPRQPEGPQQLALFEEVEAAAPAALSAVPTVQAVAAGYRTVDSQEALEELVEELARSPAFALDTETTSTDAMAADLVGIAVALTKDGEGQAHYIPVGHAQGAGSQLPLDHVLDELGPVLEDASVAKYAHNAKYDLTVLARHGIDVKGLTFDTMIAEWLIDPASRNLGLKNMAWARLGVEMTPITFLIGKGKNQITMDRVPIEQVTQYAGADVDMTYHLVSLLEPELKEKELWTLFTEVEMPLVPVLVEMEMKGVVLDVPFLQNMSGLLQGRLATLEKEIQDQVGYPFNVNSTQQLSDALFIKLGLPTKGVKKTASGHYSTAAAVLEGLKDQHPVIGLILEQRELAKLKSTYVDALPQLVNPHTGRVHTSYNQTGTVTGRVSSSDPNLQNIPIRTELGRQVRRAFVAGEGSVLLAADYSQVELRIMAHISQDPTLLEAFRRDEDIHTSTAAAILEVPAEAVTPEMRRLAKSVNFGLAYGQGSHGLAQQTGLSHEEADRFIKNYFARYPKVKEYIEHTKSQAKEQGYVETLLGRRRYFPELKREKVRGHIIAAAHRMAINAPIQGTAADILKIAMLRLHRVLHERNLKSRMILQVHDELVLEVPEDEMDTVAPLVREIMEGAFQLDAPLKVDVKVGNNWLEMEPVEG
ncbi:MAG: DNA polymerase I [Anaerolineales bacterium]|nr:MAG: DNA polymerase I [Anaerolineales bacterium]